MFGKLKAVPIVSHTIDVATNFCSAAKAGGLTITNYFALFEQVLIAFDKYLCVYVLKQPTLGDAIEKEYLSGTNQRSFFGNGKEAARQTIDRVFNQLETSCLAYVNSPNASAEGWLTTLFKTMANNLNIAYTIDTENLCYSVYDNLINYISAYCRK